MTTATLEALMKVYGILLREGWDEPDDASADRGRGGVPLGVEADFSAAIEEYKRVTGKPILTRDDILVVLRHLGYYGLAVQDQPGFPAGGMVPAPHGGAVGPQGRSPLALE